jgi:hypothetical protein
VKLGLSLGEGHRLRVIGGYEWQEVIGNVKNTLYGAS